LACFLAEKYLKRRRKRGEIGKKKKEKANITVKRQFKRSILAKGDLRQEGRVNVLLKKWTHMAGCISAVKI
jgi:hypothetical protein